MMGRRRGWNEQPVDKPYRFVDIASLTPEDRTKPPGHDRYTGLSGRLEATLAVVTPLHVGSGALEMRDDRRYPLVRGMTRSNERIVVPASTLKGMVRSVVEAVTPSCVRITRARRDMLPGGAAECRNEKSLCLACRMFGALGYEGNVRFGDAVLREGQSTMIVSMPALYAPRSRERAYYQGGQVTGRKFYRHGRTVVDGVTPVEVCRPDSQLDFVVRFDNLSAAEVGVLLTGLGLVDPPLILKVGAGKPASYGSVGVISRSLQVWAGAKDLYGDYDVARELADIDTYLHAAKNLIDGEQLRKLAQIWKFDENRECPSGNY
jgi:hypothetical protein